MRSWQRKGTKMKPHPQVWVEAERDVISMLYWLKHHLSRGRHLVWRLGDLWSLKCFQSIIYGEHKDTFLPTPLSCLMRIKLCNIGSKPWNPTKIGKIKACVACIPVLQLFHGLSSYIYWGFCIGLFGKIVQSSWDTQWAHETVCNTLYVYMLKVKGLKCAGSFRKYDNALSLQFCQFLQIVMLAVWADWRDSIDKSEQKLTKQGWISALSKWVSWCHVGGK